MTEILADIQKLYAEGYSVDSIALLCDAPMSFVVETIAQEECYDILNYSRTWCRSVSPLQRGNSETRSK